MGSGCDPSEAAEARADRGAILVLPTVAAGQLGPVAAWVSTAGWANALRKALGEVWIVTPEGRLAPDELRGRASVASLATGSGPRWQRHVPVVAKTALKDVREWRRAQSFRVDASGPWRGHDVSCVWQRHELFHAAGPRLARELGVPSVIFVPAPLVWQAEQWGVSRPGWGQWIERMGERAPLRSADVVACGTEAVAEEVRRIGVDAARIVITPTGADADVFATDPARAQRDRAAVRGRLGLDDRFVVGWIGSFRRFHAIEQAIDAIAGVDGATLLLVGDGPERARVEQQAREQNVEVVCTGTVAHDAIPEYLAAMDVGLVLAAPGQAFHYSPLKLAEYLSAGLAVIAPRIGSLPEQLRDDVDAILVEPGNTDELGRALRRLRDEPATCERLARSAHAVAAERWSWDGSVRRVLSALGVEPMRNDPDG